MIDRTSTATVARTFAVLAALAMTTAGAQAFDDAKYPNLKGQWTRARAPGCHRPADLSIRASPGGRGQQAPLTPEYQAIFEASLADQEAGGSGASLAWRCNACRPACRR